MITEKRWNSKPEGERGAIERLSKSLSIPHVLANLLVQRGVTEVEAAQRFFNPSLTELYDPFLMKDMDRAVARIKEAVEKEETILVYGDYDVDGTTAVALVFSFLASIGHKHLSFYIPDRYTEGCGISCKGIDYAHTKGAKLVIALDCGIKAMDKVEYASSLGIDFIICDHHLPGDTIPNAVAVLDPKREDCPYPFKDLSGCGVGFKLAQGYCQRYGIDVKKATSLLDLVVVAIAADIVPVVDENRILAHYGLKRINSDPNKGLGAIIKICGLDRHAITIDDIVFKIGPRINAAGRMVQDDETIAKVSGGNDAVRLLISRTDEEASSYGSKIDNFNSGRKEIDRNITKEAYGIVAEAIPSKKCTIIYNQNWIKGVVGIVASRLIERYYRPTVVLTMSNGFITGSARSIPGFDLYQAVEHCSDLLENFGGHMYAVGLTMKPENLETFKQRFEEYVDKNIEPNMLVPQIDIDCKLSLSDINIDFRKTLCKFQPFGPGNPAPIFATSNVFDDGRGRCVGSHLEHLKMDILHDGPSTISAIAFGQARHAAHILASHAFDICYTVVENTYRGEVKPQLRVKDIIPRTV